jgi:DNA primase large subunit
MLKQQASISTGRLEQYSSTLNMYNQPPQDEVSLYEFETYALDRLTVLRAVEAAKIRCKTDEESNKYIDPILNKHLNLKSNSRMNNTNTNTNSNEQLFIQRRKDHISHFILRLAFCKHDQLRRWFIKQESILFKVANTLIHQHRFKKEPQADKEEFITRAKLKFISVTVDDMIKDRLGDKYSITTSKIEHPKLTNEIRNCYIQHKDWYIYFFKVRDGASSIKFYKAPFHEVPYIVGKRACLVSKGYAYISDADEVSLVLNVFETNLQIALDLTAKALPGLDEEDRMIPILNTLSKQYISKEYTPNAGAEITHDQIPSLSQHFSPCMSSLYSYLKIDKHLKHTSRLHFGLFLKGIGLNLDESLIFWRKSFSNMSGRSFPANFRRCV